MTQPVVGDSAIMRSQGAIEERLLANLLSKPLIEKPKGQPFGSEKEIFVFGPLGLPIDHEEGQQLFKALHNHFARTVEGVEMVSQLYYGQNYKTLVKVPKLGVFSWEHGGQVEFSAEVSYGFREFTRKNSRAIRALEKVAGDLGFRLSFDGYSPEYAAHTFMAPTHRANIWRVFSSQRQFDQNTRSSILTYLTATCGDQLTFNSGGERVPDIFNALMILDPILAKKFNKSARRLDIMDNYAEHFPMMLRPITEAWQAKTAKELARHITNRLVKFEVPFLNNPWDLQDYILTDLDSGRRPLTVRALMERGGLTHHHVVNSQGLHLTLFRKFESCLLEMRLPDSTDDLDVTEKRARIGVALAYDADICTNFLASAAFMTGRDIFNMYRAAANLDKRAGLEMPVTGSYTMEQVMEHTVGDGHLWVFAGIRYPFLRRIMTLRRLEPLEP